MKILPVLLIYFVFTNVAISTDSKITPPENQLWLKDGTWAVILDSDQKAAVAFSPAKNKSKKNPYLDIWCSLSTDDDSGFDMYLKSHKGFKTKDPLVVNVMLAIDDTPGREHEWFPADNRLESVQPRALIKDMLSSKEFNIRFRDKEGLREYTFELDGLKKIIPIMEEFCGYKVDGSH